MMLNRSIAMLPLVAAAFLLVVPSIGNVCCAEDDLDALLKTSAVEMESRYRLELVSGLSATCKYDFENNYGKSREGSSTVFVFAFPCRAVETLEGTGSGDGDNPPKQEERCIVVNKTYGFDLRRRNQNSRWAVVDIATENLLAFQAKGMADDLKNLAAEELMIHRYIPVLDIEGIPIDRFLKDQFASIRDKRKTDSERVLLEISGDIPTPTGPDRILGGEIWLSPMKSWAVDEYKLTLSTVIGKSIVHRKVVWTEASGLAVPSSVTTTYTAEKVPPVENRWTFTNWERRSVPDKRFLLSHYGLPEPGAEENQQQPTKAAYYFWQKGILWVNLAILALCLGWMAIRFRRKFSSAD